MLKSFVAAVMVLAALNGLADGVSSLSYNTDNGFHPNSGYYRALDQVAEASERVVARRQAQGQGQGQGEEGKQPYREGEGRESPDQRTQRFGISNYGGSGIQGGYPSGSGSPGLYGPLKIDLGGILLGSLIGLGAVLVLPKLVQAFSYSYGGGYGRSIEAEVSAFTELISKVERTLEKNNVDSSSCAQRVACSYLQSSLDNMAVGNATDVDRFIASLSSNSLVENMLDGTAIKEAVEAGKDVKTNCVTLYPRCQLDKQTLVKIMANMLP